MKSKRLFSNSTEYAAWIDINCCECEKYNPESTLIEETCDIEFQMAMAYLDDGTMDQHYVDRIGGFIGLFLSNCKEKNLDKYHDHVDQLKFF